MTNCAPPSSERKFPVWLPPVVEGWILQHANHPEHLERQEVTQFLATDENFSGLWRELQKRHQADRADSDFVYAVRIAALDPLVEGIPRNKSHRQDLGYLYLFMSLVRIGSESHFRRALSRNEDAEQREEIKQRIVWLRREAEDTEKIPDNAAGLDWKSIAEGMRAKADVLQQVLEATRLPRLVLANKRDNARGLKAALDISATLNKFFGTYFYQQSAIAATTLTRESVTAEQVRDAIRKADPL